jgi:hypothetical protein
MRSDVIVKWGIATSRFESLEIVHPLPLLRQLAAKLSETTVMRESGLLMSPDFLIPCFPEEE